MPTLLDLFCGAGGAAMGYHRAGFTVVGVDSRPQKNYPFEFHLADALEFVAECGEQFDVIHASPPCQRYSSATRVNGTSGRHPDLVPSVRQALVRAGRPFVIENVIGSPLRRDLVLCGTMFDLRLGDYILRRHRVFESNVSLVALFCRCRRGDGRTLGVYGGGPTEKARCLRERNPGGGRPQKATLVQARDIMDIPWMLKYELNEAIPPAYTEYIGRQLLKAQLV